MSAGLYHRRLHLIAAVQWFLQLHSRSWHICPRPRRASPPARLPLPGWPSVSRPERSYNSYCERPRRQMFTIVSPLPGLKTPRVPRLGTLQVRAQRTSLRGPTCTRADKTLLFKWLFLIFLFFFLLFFSREFGEELLSCDSIWTHRLCTQSRIRCMLVLH